MTITNDPMKLIIESAKNIYPDIECRIQYNPDFKMRKFLWFKWGFCGYTTFYNDGMLPVVEVSTNIPFKAMVETLAHELAHVAVGPECQHGKPWKDAFDAIWNEYHRIGMARFGFGKKYPPDKES